VSATSASSRQEPLDPTTLDAMKMMQRADLQRLLRDRLDVVVPDPSN
jgi:hypothetical protein